MKIKKTAHDQPGTQRLFATNFSWSTSDGARYSSHTAAKGRTPREGEARLRELFNRFSPEVA
jgi:hypothetical protein